MDESRWGSEGNGGRRQCALARTRQASCQVLSVKTRLRKPSNNHRLLVLRFRLQRRATASRSQDAVRFTTNHSSHIAVRDQTPVTMPPTAIYLQKACLQHRYIRTRDNSHIVERPERLRAVNVGLAASIARLEERAQPVSVSVGKSSSATAAESKVEEDSDALTEALGKLQLSTPSRTETLAHVPVTFVHSSASVDILNDAAVKFVHGDIERDVYLENLRKWAHESQDKVARGESEIPEGYAQGDLYCECDRSTLLFTGTYTYLSVSRISRCYTRSPWHSMRGRGRYPRRFGSNHLRRKGCPISGICCYSASRSPLRRGETAVHQGFS